MSAKPTLAEQVALFFAGAPDEELDTNDIGAKFGVKPHQVHTMLAEALAAGTLERTRNDEGVYVYRAGKPASGPTQQAAPAPAGAKKQRRLGKVQLPDFNTIEIQQGTPPPGRSGPAVDYTPLFTRMQPCSYVDLPDATYFTLSNALTRHRKAHPGQLWRIGRKHTDENTLRLWRVQ